MLGFRTLTKNSCSFSENNCRRNLQATICPFIVFKMKAIIFATAENGRIFSTINRIKNQPKGSPSVEYADEQTRNSNHLPKNPEFVD